MAEAQIIVTDLAKEFRVRKRGEGLAGAVKSLFSREYTTVSAVDGINFTINRGEMVGYIGPNGAGKSTTIKMLTGILLPSGGTIDVAGRDPFRRRKENAATIGVIFGQRSSLWWDIPARESFTLLKAIYRIPEETYRQNLALFTELLDMEEFLGTPVRKLSLGQKMRCEIVAALLHDPEILYLDEPTIGLDAVSKESIRAFIKEVNRKRKTTVLLTTHDLDDIEEICNRIMIIDHGRLLYDGRLDRFKKKMLDSRTLTVDFRTPVTAGALKACLNLGDDLLALQREGKNRYRIEFRFHKTRAAELLKRILSRFEVLDVAVEDEGIESIIKRVYRGEGMR